MLEAIFRKFFCDARGGKHQNKDWPENCCVLVPWDRICFVLEIFSKL